MLGILEHVYIDIKIINGKLFHYHMIKNQIILMNKEELLLKVEGLSLIMVSIFKFRSKLKDMDMNPLGPHRVWLKN